MSAIKAQKNAEITLNGENLMVGAVNVKLTAPVEDFPPIPEYSATEIHQIDAAELRKIFKRHSQCAIPMTRGHT